ncbi:MAG: hypothetical protein M8840_13160, partial [marine benthic group bacterium]|nr:hypothetical protein [Gemmatimonadota bacterium]
MRVPPSRNLEGRKPRPELGDTEGAARRDLRRARESEASFAGASRGRERGFRELAFAARKRFAPAPFL